MIKAVIFDCFGVLMVDAITAYQDLHPEIASDLDDLDRQADAGFISQAEQIEGYKKLTGDDEQTIVNYLRKEHRLNEPIVQMIKQLKVSYKVGMLSNIGAKWYQQLVPEDVRDLFDQTILSGDVGMVKPYPEIFEFALEKMELLPSETIFIDDILDNCEGAKAIGIEAVFYKSVATATQTLSKYGVNI